MYVFGESKNGNKRHFSEWAALMYRFLKEKKWIRILKKLYTMYIHWYNLLFNWNETIIVVEE